MKLICITGRSAAKRKGPISDCILPARSILTARSRRRIVRHKRVTTAMCMSVGERIDRLRLLRRREGRVLRVRPRGAASEGNFVRGHALLRATDLDPVLGHRVFRRVHQVRAPHFVARRVAGLPAGPVRHRGLRRRIPFADPREGLRRRMRRKRRLRQRLSLTGRLALSRLAEDPRLGRALPHEKGQRGSGRSKKRRERTAVISVVETASSERSAIIGTPQDRQRPPLIVGAPSANAKRLLPKQRGLRPLRPSIRCRAQMILLR